MVYLAPQKWARTLSFTLGLFCVTSDIAVSSMMVVTYFSQGAVNTEEYSSWLNLFEALNIYFMNVWRKAPRMWKKATKSLRFLVNLFALSKSSGIFNRTLAPICQSTSLSLFTRSGLLEEEPNRSATVLHIYHVIL